MESLGYLETYQSSIEDQNHLPWMQQRDLVDAEPLRAIRNANKDIGCRGSADTTTETTD
ncbi:hypothetical protein SCLCIDRAFT_1224437, partial [Scleroderma citrinum Foug A]